MDDRKKMGIYVHIPFCIRKCLYCDFLSDTADISVIKQYIEALKNEIRCCRLGDIDYRGQYMVDTIFFGGGTPSILDGEQIGEIMEALSDRFDISNVSEVTLECNPGTVTREKIKSFKKFGINRLSIGLQSANSDELKILGRIHDPDQFFETFRLAREEGFDNINIDLMSAIPGQTLESYKKTLETVIELRPEHISAYSLIVEEETPYYEVYGEFGNALQDCGIKPPAGFDAWPPLPDEDTEREMYYMTERLLSEAGYHRYEISNYSLDGFECRHNSSYWTGTDYIGLGVGAAGFIDGVRYSNTSDIYSYMKACMKMDDIPAEEYHALSVNERMEEFMFLGLRMMRGISAGEFKIRFGRDIENVYGKQLNKLKNDGLIISEGDNIRLTSRGIDVSNTVFANFLL